MKLICKFILFTILRWKVEGEFQKECKKYILIVAPHTSWVDFPITVLVNYATGLKANFVGKSSLFNPPFGFLFKSVGGAPVDRTKNSNVVDSIIDIFNSRERFILGIAPEGTRKKVEKWKTGFYYIAKGANVPIYTSSLDFENKKITISDKPFYPTDDKEADFNYLHSFFKDIKGKVPEYS
jgi:1-acyl-sn-glycerol-3-phosphate acyltransferase